MYIYSGYLINSYVYGHTVTATTIGLHIWRTARIVFSGLIYYEPACLYPRLHSGQKRQKAKTFIGVQGLANENCCTRTYAFGYVLKQKRQKADSLVPRF